MAKGIAALIWFGLPGHVIEYVTVYHKGGSCKSSLDGYDTPEQFQTALDGGKYADTEIPDGTIVIDKRATLQRNPMLALSGPLYSDEGPSRFIDDYGEGGFLVDGIIDAFSRGGAEAATIAKAANIAKDNPKVTAFDSVDAKTYRDWWFKHGARVGCMVNRQIRWSRIEMDDAS